MTQGLPINQTYKRAYRTFYQPGGPYANIPLRYSGRDGARVMVGDVTIPVVGGVETHYNFSDSSRDGFDLSGFALTPPGNLPEGDVTIRNAPGRLSLLQAVRTGVVSFYNTGGECGGEPGDPESWNLTLRVYSCGLRREIGQAAQVAFDGADAVIEDSNAMTWLGGVYNVAPLTFGAQLSALTIREQIDTVYGAADCFGQNPNGTDWLYTLRAGAAGTAPDVLYQTPISSGAVAVTGAASAEVAKAIRVVGSRILVLTEAGLYVGTISTTGVPSGFVKVATGFTVPANAPQDMYVVSGQEIFIVGNGGYIYKSTDPIAGVTAINPGNSTTGNLTRIHGNLHYNQNLLVAVGAAGAVLYSTDRGNTWSVGAAPSAQAINAVQVLRNGVVWVGTSDGRIYFSRDRCQSWQEKIFDGSGIGAVQDIKAPTDDVVYFSTTTATPTARIYSTWNGGSRIVTSGSPSFVRFATLPLFNRANRLAFPNNASPEIRANYLSIAGLATGGTTGVLYSGAAPFN